MVISVGLGMDAMAVCTGIGVKWHGRREKFRLAWHMGLFQFLGPILGWFIGKQFAGLLAGVGEYLGAGIVFVVGVKMLYEALRSYPRALAERTEHLTEQRLHVTPRDPTRGWSLIALSVATSIDALAVGFSFGLRGDDQVWKMSVVIGVVAGVMALCGVVIGKHLGKALGQYAEVFGAILLMGVGVALLCW